MSSQRGKEIKYLILLVTIVTTLTLVFSNKPIESSLNISNENSKGNPIVDASIKGQFPRYKLQYSSYFGGTIWDEYGAKVEVDQDGYPWIVGFGAASDFPIVGGFNSTPNDYSIIVMKLSPDGGEILYSTYITGNYKDYPSDMVFDANGDLWITGSTYSTNFPVTPNALNKTYTNISTFVSEGFLIKISGIDGSLQYSSYIGGDNVLPRAIATDNSGYIWITGRTDSNRFPITATAVDDTYAGGDYDGFLSQFSPDGERLLFSTFIGGKGTEDIKDIEIDGGGDVWVTGFTTSGRAAGFPITDNALDTSHNGAADAFIFELDTADIKFPVVSYCSYLGGSDSDTARSISMDSRGIYIVGDTESSDFPTVNALDASYGGGKDIFVYKMSLKGEVATLQNSTYIGGSASEYGYSSVLDNEKNLWITGETSSTDFPVVGAYDDTLTPPNSDVFVLRLSNSINEIKYSTFLGGPDDDIAFGLGYDGENDRIWVTGIAFAGFPIVDGYDSDFDGYSEIFVSYFGPLVPPTPPRDLSGLLSLDGKILLIWGEPKDSSDSPLDYYNVYKGLTNSSLAYYAETTSLGYIDADITSNTTYYYSITAVNNIGESEHSNLFMLAIPDIGNLTKLLNTSLPESTSLPGVIFGISVLGIIVILRRQKR